VSELQSREQKQTEWLLALLLAQMIVAAFIALGEHEWLRI
jgi:hypothetical protein